MIRRRTGLKRSVFKRTSTTPKQRGGLRSRSPRKKTANAKYEAAKQEHFRESPGCQFPGCCRSLRKGDLCDLHHKAGRNGPLLYRREFFATLCREHHEYVENNLSWSRENGWIIDLSSDEVWRMKLEEKANA